MTRRLTMAQAIIQFLKAQSVARDGKEQTFFGGCLGIFGHGNVAGIGQALQQNPDFPTTCSATNRPWFTRQRVLPK
jgi:3D-(3,5/4)-trihydroxycyclohexane-1,2-dione acylhydrolase (decyclizing)